MTYKITYERLRELLTYNSETGAFIWNMDRKCRQVKAGDVAGHKSRLGYMVTGIDGSAPMLMHRLAWFYVYGQHPSEQIDHINGNRSDNRLINLRVVNNQQNNQNRHILRSTNTSGYAGVSWHKQRSRWNATITVSGKKKSLGLYASAKEAGAIAAKARAQMHEGYISV
jgi:hypothetical protein